MGFQTEQKSLEFIQKRVSDGGEKFSREKNGNAFFCLGR